MSLLSRIRSWFSVKDAPPVFPANTRLLSGEDLVRENFEHGVEMLNDDATPMEFVVGVLMRHVQMNRDEAIKAMLKIHSTGRLAIPLASRELAEHIATLVSSAARQQNHPLVCRPVTAQQRVHKTTVPFAPDRRSMRLSTGQSLSYYVVGTQHTSTPILLLHGIPDASDSWDSIAAQLEDAHPVYAVDLVGYGNSDCSEGQNVSLSAQADYVREFLVKLELSRVILVGHDIGGGVAQILAVHDPQRVYRLVLINSVIHDHWPVLEMRMLRVPVLGYTALTLLEKPMWRYILHKGFFNKQAVTESVLHRYQRWYQGAIGRRRLVRNARALDHSDLTTLADAIRTLPMPALMLWGRTDRFLNAEPAQALCRDLPDCRFSFIERGGHFVLDEQSPILADTIRQFLLRKQ